MIERLTDRNDQLVRKKFIGESLIRFFSLTGKSDSRISMIGPAAANKKRRRRKESAART